jgi:hypothetical protein
MPEHLSGRPVATAIHRAAVNRTIVHGTPRNARAVLGPPQCQWNGGHVAMSGPAG